MTITCQNDDRRLNLANTPRVTEDSRSRPAPWRWTGRRRDRPVRFRREIFLTRAGLAVTAIALAAFEVDMVHGEVGLVDRGSLGAAALTSVVAAVVTFLVYGNLVYQVARLGYLVRRRRHRPPSWDELGCLYDGEVAPVLTLIPSYREEPEVIRQALLSAAVQDYPGKRVVLLIDDPPRPSDRQSRQLLAQARALPDKIERLLQRPARHARSTLNEFEVRLAAAERVGVAADRGWLDGEARRLGDEHRWARRWFETLADRHPVETHTDALFVKQVLLGAARAHHLRELELTERTNLDAHSLWLGYRRIFAQFDVEVTSFERKSFANLSHEPNKAMNLNSYLTLLGRAWRRESGPDGDHLVSVEEGPADMVVPDAAYIATLDADSLLLPCYLTRLVHYLEQPGHERMAVAQTPYSAIPDAPGSLERTAGATTDLQYIVHQGFTRHAATFWVGANALIRRRALQDLETITEERGFPIHRYIQDRTVIEDTESTVDLLSAGWQLVNYPERLSFSATPPDFGSLIVQRRRWANGGLLILPKLLGHLARRGIRALGCGTWMRLHYLTSISGVNLGLLLLLSVPLATPKGAIWIPVTAAPYFYLYARDLRQAGYRHRDIIEVYALNLLLVPVNLAGVAKSIYQGVTKTKIPFGRTPKIAGRTRTPGVYLLTALALLAYWTIASIGDAVTNHFPSFAFETTNIVLLAYAMGRFIGWQNLKHDLRPQARPTVRTTSPRLGHLIRGRRPIGGATGGRGA